MARFQDYLRDVESGDAFLTGNGEIRGPDGALIATTVPNPTTGLRSWQANGNPAGKITWEITQAGQTRKVEGDATVQVAGELFLAELVDILRLFSDEVIEGVVCSASGGMNISVGVGTLLNRGRPHRWYTAETKAIGASDPTNPRMDRVISRLVRTGSFAGKLTTEIQTGPLADNAVTNAKMADNSVGNAEIIDGSIALVDLSSAMVSSCL